MLTADTWISTADGYLLEDLVDLKEWIFRVGYGMGQMGISFGRMDFWLCVMDNTHVLSEAKA